MKGRLGQSALLTCDATTARPGPATRAADAKGTRHQLHVRPLRVCKVRSPAYQRVLADTRATGGDRQGRPAERRLGFWLTCLRVGNSPRRMPLTVTRTEWNKCHWIRPLFNEAERAFAAAVMADVGPLLIELFSVPAGGADPGSDVETDVACHMRVVSSPAARHISAGSPSRAHDLYVMSCQ